MTTMRSMYSEYEKAREEFNAFCSNSKHAAVVKDYEILKDKLERATERVKKFYGANHEDIGPKYKDFSIQYATVIDAAMLVQLLGDDSDMYIEYKPVVNRDAYEAGLRSGNISTKIASKVEKKTPRIYAPKY